MPKLIGLDLAPDSVRAVVVRTGWNKREVLRYAFAPYDYSQANDLAGAREAALRAVVGEIGDASARVYTALDGAEASLRIVELPLAAKKRIADVLPFELDSLLPFPAEEAAIDHAVLAPTDPKKVRLLAAATRLETVRDHLERFRAAGIDPHEIGVGAAALEGLTAFEPTLRGEGPYLVIDVEPSRTDVCVLRAGRVEFARTLTPTTSAERGDDALLRALSQTLTAYRAGGGSPPVSAWLTGRREVWATGAYRGAATTDLVPVPSERVRAALEVDVHELSPPPAVGAEGYDRSLFARALALAGGPLGRAKRLNLRQGELAQARAMGAIRRHAKTLAWSGAAIAASIAFSTYARWVVLEDEHTRLSTELAAVTKDAFGVETSDPLKVRELLDGTGASHDPLPRFDALHMLSAISEAIPETITHDTRRLTIELKDDGFEGRFDLQGTVGSIEERDQVAERLDAHECVQDLEKGRTSPGVGENRVNYQLEAVIRCPGAPRPTKARGGRSTGGAR